jgi:hypothetical protein
VAPSATPLCPQPQKKKKKGKMEKTKPAHSSIKLKSNKLHYKIMKWFNFLRTFTVL